MNRLNQPTPTELLVLELIVKGLPNKKIAEALEIGERTVNSHISALYSKSGIWGQGGRVRLATWAIDSGFCEPPVQSESYREKQAAKRQILAEIEAELDEQIAIMRGQFERHTADFKTRVLRKAEQVVGQKVVGG